MSIFINNVADKIAEIKFLRERYGNSVGLVEAKMIVDIIEASQNRKFDDSILRYQMMHDRTKDALLKAKSHKSRC